MGKLIGVTARISSAGDTLVNEIHQLVLEIELMDLQGTMKKDCVQALAPVSTGIER